MKTIATLTQTDLSINTTRLAFKSGKLLWKFIGRELKKLLLKIVTFK